MLREDVLDMLEKTSRTFFISITRLPDGLREAMAAGYLCMRAIDEIEDHPALDGETKARLLRDVSHLLQSQIGSKTIEAGLFEKLLSPHTSLPEVSQKLATWAAYVPAEIAAAIWHNTSAMADRMAYWALRDWKIEDRVDLDAYTFSVAGTVGLMICEVWGWFSNERLDLNHAVYFGRALQLVNIIRNHQEDLVRGADFFPEGWDLAQMIAYARKHLELTSQYMQSLQAEAFTYIIHLPLELAKATLDAIEQGQEKLSREAVLHLVQQMG